MKCLHGSSRVAPECGNGGGALVMVEVSLMVVRGDGVDVAMVDV